MSQILKTIGLALMGLIAVYFYYIFYPFHGESKQGIYIYFGIVLCVYGAFLSYRYLFVERISSITVKFIGIVFLLQLLFLCMYFFFLNGQNFFLGTYLFIKIVFILLCISFLWSVFWGFGKTIFSLKFFPEIQNTILSNTISVAFGFSVFIYFVFLGALFGWLNIYFLSLLILLFFVISFKILAVSYSGFWNYELQNYEHNTKDNALLSEKLNISRLIDEFHYIAITFLLCVNFISVFRPFPIGWDDLGVYMNFPKLLSSGGELLDLGKMFTWELYTSIGFIFGSQTYAFFLNSFSGVIAAIIIGGLIRLVVGKKHQSFDISLLSILIILMMPMSIFQLAKDMKLDFGLLFISVSALIGFFAIILKREESMNLRKNIFLFSLIGIFIAIAFSIKLTSVLLLISILGGLSYARGGLKLFFSFFFLFVGIMTVGNMWSMMNVVISVTHNVQLVGIFLLILGSILCLSSLLKDRKNTVSFVGEISIILIAFIITLLPWGIKNISETIKASENIGVSSFLLGTPDVYYPDYSIIYTPEELSVIKEGILGTMSQSGTSDNADLGRYFGYETGINNYLKLPWNLTFQVNQKGEFTDVTFIFFALIPLIFIFLPYKKESYSYAVFGALFLLLLYYIPVSGISHSMTTLFSYIDLPYGYFIICLFFVIPFLYFAFTLNSQEKFAKIFLVTYSMSMLYVFLWAISAFGIVWYGIVMYVIFLLLICITIGYINKQSNCQYTPVHFIILMCIWIYLFQSAFPHGISNIRTASAVSYKLGYIDEQESIFLSHLDYFPILFHTNIASEKREDFFIQYRNDFIKILDTQETQELVLVLQSVKTITDLHGVINQLLAAELGSIEAPIRELRKEMYDAITFPSNQNKNTSAIYRAGTFLRYYISENYKRLLEDSLLENFQNYFYDTDSSVITQRLKKVGIESLLLDLNAATIDQDPKKSLTKRYENLLRYFTSPDLELIETDSICLKVALTGYREDNDMDKYMSIAGLNYGDDRNQKKSDCLVEILTLIQEGKVSQDQNNFLRPIDAYVKNNLKNELTGEEATIYYVNLIAPHIPNGYKAFFEIQ